MRTHRVYAYGAALGFLGDLVAGDPRRGHPVAGFGRVAGALERRMWRDDRFSGAVYAALCAGGAMGAAALARRSVRSSAVLSVGLTAVTTWSVLGGTSLAREARTVAAALDAGDLDAARERLPHLCGRDPHGLDADGIARAVVESVAENTSDAVVGALVWGALGGVPGLAGFRAANTLDAMVGHRSPRHLRFGWAAARLDDAAGYPGARLTAALTVLSAPHPRSALRTWRRDAAAHPSPNAGPVEAAFAGALRLRLGGTLAYGGRTEHRPVLGPEFRPPAVPDIARAVRLSRRVSALALASSILLSAGLEHRDSRRRESAAAAAGRGDRPTPPAGVAGQGTARGDNAAPGGDQARPGVAPGAPGALKALGAPASPGPGPVRQPRSAARPAIDNPPPRDAGRGTAVPRRPRAGLAAPAAQPAPNTPGPRRNPPRTRREGGTP